MNIMMVAQFLVIIIGCGLGVFVFLKPQKVIDLQIRFYALINWKLTPISMEKEIRNTRMMGFILILFALGAVILRILGGVS